MELSGCIFTGDAGGTGNRSSGIHVADKLEILLNERTKRPGAEHVNLQPYSGPRHTTASTPPSWKLGDRARHASRPRGHLTMASSELPVEGLSVDSYGWTRRLKSSTTTPLRRRQGSFAPSIISGKLIPRIDYERIYEIAGAVGAYHMVDMAHVAGLVGAKAARAPSSAVSCRPHNEDLLRSRAA